MWLCQDVRISDQGRPQELSEQIYKTMAEMTILVTQLVVECAKQLPGFNNINREDQIVLLKVSRSLVRTVSLMCARMHHEKSLVKHGYM